MFYQRFLFIILVCGFVSSYSSFDFQKVYDKSTIVFSLTHYNVSKPGGESIESFYTLSPESDFKILVTSIPPEVHFVVIQVHSYLVNLILSYDESNVLNNSVTGTNIGLLKMHSKSDITFYLKNERPANASVMVAVQAYGVDAPVPGGCNMEFQVEVSPFLQTISKEATTEVDFAPAAPPLSVLSPSLLFLNNECNIKPSPVHHVMYHQYFPEQDFTKETYFKILQSMMTRGRILKSSKQVPEKLTGSPVRRIFASYTGTGHAFVVLSHFENQTSVYVPSFTYNCNHFDENGTCDTLSTPVTRILCGAFLIMGLLACFFGHFFYLVQIFLLGFFASGIISHFIFSFFLSSSTSTSLAISFGFFLAVLSVLLRKIFGHPIVSLTVATLSLGFVLASVLFYAITDYVDIFVMDINYWGIFIGIVVAFPFLMAVLAEKANIAACAVVGSYVVIAAIDYYIGSNLRYIVMNIIRRATVQNFNLAIIGPPFQIHDTTLCIVWIILVFFGIVIQRALTKYKPPYPPMSGRSDSGGLSRRVITETSPLLYDSHVWTGSYGV